MKKVKYAKYNRERVPEFQISTIILEENGKRYVQKRPLCPQAVKHIQAFGERYSKLKELYLNVSFQKPEYEGENVSFSFLLGENVATILEAELNDLPKLLEKIHRFLDIMFLYNEEYCLTFTETESYRAVFGPAPQALLGKKAVRIANVDTIFDNYIISEGRWHFIDYEWVLEFPMPVEYMTFRTLFYFYNKNRDSLEKNISQEEFLKEYGISQELQQIYEEMEEGFQQYVHGKDREYIYMKNYGKTAITFTEAIESRDRKIQENTQELIQTHKALAETLSDAQRTHSQLDQANQTIQHFQKTPAGVAIRAGKKLGRGVKKAGRGAENGCKMVAKKLLPKRVYQTAVILKNEGREGLKYAVNASKYGDNAMYVMWMQENEKNLTETRPLSYNPLISVVVPVYNVADEMLIAMIDSVRNQTYKNWELVLVDDKSTQESVRTTLAKYENVERIKVIYREENGHISKATNTGFEAATGEFVALLDCDDLLAVNALYAMACMLNENPDYDFIYSDEDKISEDGTERRDPFFKPDWSPDTFMSYMYTCHFAMYRKSLIDELGGMRVGLEGSQDYDLVLRVMEQTSNIGHVPQILYHWRMRKESTASDLTAKPYIVESTIKAKEDALARRGVTGKITCIKEVQQYRVTYDPIGNPRISIIIPSKDNYTILKQCIDSIQEQTTYSNYEIIVVDNGSSLENRTKYQKLVEAHQGQYLYHKETFNFSHMCNIGASHANGSLLLFLNDDIKVTEPQWLNILAGQAGQKHTGAVGCKLLYPDTNLIQHAGVVNYEIGPGHAFHKFDDSLNLYWGRNILDYNYTIVTGACLMVDKKKFEEIGGFEETLPVAYNDVDLCFKLVEKGYFNVLRNDVTLYHYESISRGDDVAPEKAARLKSEADHLYEMHPDFVGYDPCYNPNLVPDRGDFSFNIHGTAKVAEAIQNYSLKGMRKEEQHLKYAIDNIMTTRDHVVITGWAYLDSEKKANKQPVKLVLRSRSGKTLVYQAEKTHRPDLTPLFGRGAVMAGIKCKIAMADFGEEEFKLAVELDGKYVITEKVIKL